MKTNSWLYTAILGATMLAGCQSPTPTSVSKPDLESKVHCPTEDFDDFEPEVEKIIKEEPTGVEEVSIEEEVAAFVEQEEMHYGHRVINAVHESYDAPITLDMNPDVSEIPKTSQTSMFTLDVDLLDLGTFRDSDFNLGSVTYDFGRKDYSFSQTFANYNQPPLLDQRREFEDYRDTDFGMYHAQILLRTARVMVYELAQDRIDPFIYLNRLIVYCERIGKRLRKIEQGIQSIFELDLGNLVDDLQNPLKPLLHSVGYESDATPTTNTQPYTGSRRRNKPEFSGSMYFTVNGRQIGVRTVDAIINGERLDPGIAIQGELRF